MIKIYMEDKGFIVKGHADYAPYGEDIICSAVSAIVQTAQMGLERLAEDYPLNIEIIDFDFEVNDEEENED